MFLKGSIYIYLIFILVLISIPLHTNGDYLSYESSDEEITSDIQLYQHFSHRNHGSNCLLTWPCEEEQQQIMENTLYFRVATFGERYDLRLKGNTIVHFEQWISSEMTTLIEIVYSLSDNNETILLSESASFLIDSTPTNCGLDIEIPQNGFIINKSHDLYLILEFNNPSLVPNQITIYAGSYYTSGLSFTIEEPIKVELDISEGHIKDKPEEKCLFIIALFTTPFGGENLEDYDLRIDGPTDERDLHIASSKCIMQQGSRDLIWEYTKKDPKPGKYVIHLNATNRQGISGEDEYVFILEDKDQLQDPIRLWLFVIMFTIAIILIAIFVNIRKRKMKGY